jgi:hypothetical protein
MAIKPGAMIQQSVTVMGIVGQYYVMAHASYVNDIVNGVQIVKRQGYCSFWEKATGKLLFSDVVSNADQDQDGQVDDRVEFSAPEADTSRCVFVTTTGAKLDILVNDVVNRVHAALFNADGSVRLDTGLQAMVGSYTLNVAQKYATGAAAQLVNPLTEREIETPTV